MFHDVEEELEEPTGTATLPELQEVDHKERQMWLAARKKWLKYLQSSDRLALN